MDFTPGAVLQRARSTNTQKSPFYCIILLLASAGCMWAKAATNKEGYDLVEKRYTPKKCTKILFLGDCKPMREDYIARFFEYQENHKKAGARRFDEDWESLYEDWESLYTKYFRFISLAERWAVRDYFEKYEDRLAEGSLPDKEGLKKELLVSTNHCEVRARQIMAKRRWLYSDGVETFAKIAQDYLDDPRKKPSSKLALKKEWEAWTKECFRSNIISNDAYNMAREYIAYATLVWKVFREVYPNREKRLFHNQNRKLYLEQLAPGPKPQFSLTMQVDFRWTLLLRARGYEGQKWRVEKSDAEIAKLVSKYG